MRCFRHAPLVSIALLFLAIASQTHPALAEAPPTAADSPIGIPELPRVVVRGAAEVAGGGKENLDRETIEKVPAANGSLNEIITILPGIQVGEGARASRTAGEILPPDLSISGGKIYQNDFRIDGLGNNSLLDPAFRLQNNVDNVPGHPQELFIDPELLDPITVFRSNVPARYGRFTGGVVEARTRRPSAAFGLSTAFRTTRSEWTRFHTARENRAEFENSASEADQPNFRKEDARVTFDLPVSKSTGLLLHYSILHSRIPLDHLGGSEDQERLLQNGFMKVLAEPSPGTEWVMTAFWAPYESEYFLKKVRGSGYNIEGGGYGLSAELKKYLAAGVVELTAGYRESFNNREAPAAYFNWRNSPSKDWGPLVGENFSREGGFGDVEKEQKTFALAAHFTAEPIRTGHVLHIPAAGLELERAEGAFRRTENLNRYLNASVNDNVVCAPDDPSCVSGEQFMIYQTKYEADDAAAAIRFYAVYLEDAVTLGRLTLRPGLRISRNDLMDNTDLAHRLAASYDVFGDGRTILSAGVNRYYGKTFLTHALNEEKTPYTAWTRPNELDGANRPQPWEEKPRTSIAGTRLADLDTPYVNEVTAGLGQALFGGRLDLLFIQRRGRDELTLRTLEKDDEGFVYTEWNNEGSTRHREVSLSWERRWQRQLLLLNATWQETETSHLYYGERFEGDDQEDPVRYQGRILERSALPAPDFNRAWTANLLYSARLPLGFSFTNATRYRSGYRALRDSGENTEEEGFDIYEEVKNPEAWIFDWTLAWQRRFPTRGDLTLSLEIFNVFNEKVPVGASDTDYELGRQFWASAAYAF